MCKQVKFRIVNEDLSIRHDILGGIGIYEIDGNNNKTLLNVICGCCGEMFEPEDVEIIEICDGWKDLSI